MRDIQRLSPHWSSNAAIKFHGLPCMCLAVVWNGIARGEKPLPLALRLLCISLRVARVLTYLSCLRAVGDASLF